MKKFRLAYEPDLEIIEEKFKDTIKEPFLKMQSFYRVYGNVGGQKINIEDYLSDFPKYFKTFNEFLIWSFYTPITLHAILGRFTFYLKDSESYYEDIKQAIFKTVYFSVFYIF